MALTTTLAQPVLLRPWLEPKPWGGRRLEQWGITLPPDETIGEAHLTSPHSIVATGELAGMSLAELARDAPEVWVGRQGLAATGGREIFPLLVKLIDAQTDLSIQVHADDRAAAAAGLGTGKTEAHHVLAAEPGSVFYLGLQRDADDGEFAAACRRGDGSAARLLRQVPAVPGMTILVPAGTLHALGGGLVVYEIQQPSNVTFRLDDWGRVDAAGAARPLHHEEGLPLIAPQARPEPIPPLLLSSTPARRELLVATRYFALERIAFALGDVVQIGGVESPQVLTCLAGKALLASPNWAAPTVVGETVAVPSGMGVTLAGTREGVLLRGWAPDLARDVIAPARLAGASEAATPPPGRRAGRN